MGQYFYAYIKNSDDEEKAYNRYSVGKSGKETYHSAKLTEFSWIGNIWGDSVAKELVGKPSVFATVGDYATDWVMHNEKELDPDFVKKVQEVYQFCWAEPVKTMPVKERKMSYEKKFFVNHTKKQYLSYDEYKTRSVCWVGQEDWVLNPLFLLTAIGNGEGGGDYHGSCSKYIGAWAMDVISIESKPTTGYDKVGFAFKCPI